MKLNLALLAREHSVLKGILMFDKVIERKIFLPLVIRSKGRTFKKILCHSV